jgi:hypothetical protein
MKQAILHFRNHDKKTGVLKNTGGTTLAIEKTSRGFKILPARCANKDPYNKRIGRLIATGRLRHYDFPVFSPEASVAVLKQLNAEHNERYSEEFFGRLLSKLEDAA